MNVRCINSAAILTLINKILKKKNFFLFIRAKGKHYFKNTHNTRHLHMINKCHVRIILNYIFKQPAIIFLLLFIYLFYHQKQFY